MGVVRVSARGSGQSICRRRGQTICGQVSGGDGQSISGLKWSEYLLGRNGQCVCGCVWPDDLWERVGMGCKSGQNICRWEWFKYVWAKVVRWIGAIGVLVCKNAYSFCGLGLVGESLRVVRSANQAWIGIEFRSLFK